MEENKNALDEINKGCTMGIEAIDDLIEKIDSEEFKNILLKQLKEYKVVNEKIHKLYEKYSDSEPHEISEFTKKMTEYMMNLKTINNHTDSKIAEILLQGTNMGIIEGRRILNNKKLKKEVVNIIDEFVGIQEKSVENIKKYL